jgi:hypothetical protein
MTATGLSFTSRVNESDVYCNSMTIEDFVSRESNRGELKRLESWDDEASQEVKNEMGETFQLVQGAKATAAGPTLPLSHLPC